MNNVKNANVKLTNEEILALRETREGLEMIMEHCEGVVKKQVMAIYINDITYDFDDKLQEGMMALYKAIQSFNIDVANNSQNDFYTYATRAIKNELISRAGKFKAKKRGYSEQEEKRATALSLDMMYEGTEGEVDTLLDKMVDETVDVHKQATYDEWGWMGSFLTDRELIMLKDYFLAELTYEEIGAKNGVTKQGARKNVQSAITKLKNRFSEGGLAEMLELR